MIEQLAPWGVAFVLALLGGGFGWVQAKKHGGEKRGRIHAEKERDAAINMAIRRGNPLETPLQRRRSAFAELDRRMRND